MEVLDTIMGQEAQSPEEDEMEEDKINKLKDMDAILGQDVK